ncbi:MAG: hypothetical protein GXY06_06170 [Clostridiaceae bacterium]|nr:hypothetical protein [Clostridiaceae bacterium]
MGDICRRGEAQRHLPEGVGAGDICRRTTKWATFAGGRRSGRHLTEGVGAGDICRRTTKWATFAGGRNVSRLRDTGKTVQNTSSCR